MSRIGKQPVPIPSGVTVTVNGKVVTIKGPKGELTQTIHPDIAVEIADNEIRCRVDRSTKQAGALWGTMRALLASAVIGVTEGFRKQLELQGVGYRAAVKGKDLELALGFSHSVHVKAPEGITLSVEKEVITVEGTSAPLVGQVAADIRKIRPPEPYKGKGIRYVGEHVRRKVGKVVGAAAS